MESDSSTWISPKGSLEAKERLLEHVLGICHAAQHAVRDREEQAPVFVEDCEGTLVSDRHSVSNRSSTPDEAPDVRDSSGREWDMGSIGRPPCDEAAIRARDWCKATAN